MKSRTLPVKRKPVPKGVFRRLSAVTRSRKQRVAAAATPTEMEAEDAGSKVSRALTIIFMIHIVAIALIFVHQKFLDGRAPEPAAEAAAESAVPPTAAPVPRENLPRLANGGRVYIVRSGDNYARIAAAEGVDEAELRTLNNNVDIVPKLILNLPPKRIVAEEPPEVVSIRENTPSDVDRGLVEVVPEPPRAAPAARLVRPNVESGAASGRTYVVKPGDSVWRISQNFGVDQNELMKANGIADARKMKVGMKLRIP